MDWLKELLKTAGVDESKIEGIVTGFNKEVPKHLVPKAKYNEVSSAKSQLEKDVSERDEQLEELKSAAGASEELKNQIQTLQDENKTAKETHAAELKELQLSNAIKLALSGKVHDADLASSLIDKEKLVVADDGKIVGLDEQLTSLQESKGFLFIPEGDPTPNVKGAKPTEGDPGGTPPKSLGLSFAKNANEKTSNGVENNPWG